MDDTQVSRIICQLENAAVEAGLATLGPGGWAPTPGRGGEVADFMQQLLDGTAVATA